MIVTRTAKNLIKSAFPNWAQKYGFKKYYEQLAADTDDMNFPFMNYGYCPSEGKEFLPTLSVPYSEYNYHAALYRHVVEQIDLTGRTVLEVGCGRGGGCYYMREYLNAEQVIGFDLSPTAIKLCNEKFDIDNLRFLEGDAENFPIEDNSVDVVVNVESSHCYPKLEAFFQEVKRVLKPGGYFAYTDFGTVERMQDVRSKLEKNGLEIKSFTDITANVVKSIEEDDVRRTQLLMGISDDQERVKGLSHFARLAGSPGHKSFCNREEIYESFLIQVK